MPQGDRSVRRARARPEHIHTYRITPLGLWNARAAGHDAEQVVDTLLDLQPVRRPARPARRRRGDDGALRAAPAREAPGARAGAGLHRPAGARGGAARQAHPGAARRAARRRHRRRARLGARPPQAGAAQARLAGRGPRRLRRRRGAPDRARPDGVVAAPVPAPGGRLVLARRLRRRGAALRRRQDARRRGRDGRGQGDHADPRHQHGQRPAVAGRAAQAHVPHGRGDRRVLGHGQGGPARHDRDVPDPDDQAEGRLRPPRAARRPRLGPHRLRRGAPAAGPGLPDDRRPAGPPPPRPDRDARARGRPRGRRVLA